jgi:DNA invertase Pin-like site-specific DNA recombinase
MALVESVQALSRGDREYTSDIVTESCPLIFRSSSQGVSILFADAAVAGNDLRSFELRLKAIIRQVLSEFGDDSEIPSDSFWAQLERYAKE